MTSYKIWADVVELVDTLVLGTSAQKGVKVRVLSSAPVDSIDRVWYNTISMSYFQTNQHHVHLLPEVIG